MTEVGDYRLEDRYVAETGKAFLSGIQALGRIPVDQLRRDRARGLNTAAFLTGYQGSPLATLDKEAKKAAELATDVTYIVQPGLNEELAAGAVAGSQLAAAQLDCRYDGIVGFWYGKTPGLDRSGDSIRHGVYTGTSDHGGAVAIVGDDPAAKSSTLPGSSLPTLAALGMPVLHPGDVQDVLDLGLHAVAMSRASGLWVALKVTTAVADGTSTVVLDGRLPVIETFEPHDRLPDAQLLPPHSVEIEADLLARRAIAIAYAKSAGLNTVDVEPGTAWLTIISGGHALRECRAALGRAGLVTDDSVAQAGIRIVNLRMPFPFDDDIVQDATRDCEQILVVEEKDDFVEQRVRAALYGQPNQPPITGKFTPAGQPAIPAKGGIGSATVSAVLQELLAPRGLVRDDVPAERRRRIPVSVSRQPYFCSGCPHNWGTKVPDGALVGAGIGCHTMALFMDEERVGTITGVGAMGMEGSHWIGMSPFVDRPHMFQNLGDGTYFHSGQLAVQAAIASGVNITYKLLFNGTVAMTGGQDAVGATNSVDTAKILLAQGVKRVIITAEDLERIGATKLPDGINLWHRDRIVEAQEMLAKIPGVTVLIHDQHCAAELRRTRHRDPLPTTTKRIAINHRICEACGDCGDVSNCLSIQPVDTPLGQKMSIDQHSCNLDYSCVEGDCPAFMEITPQSERAPAAQPTLPVISAPPSVLGDHHALKLVGIGGTGVVTTAQVIATAAMLDGWHVRGLDQTGLAQKGGPVVSDLLFDRNTEPLSNTVGAGEASAIIAFDLLGAVAERVLTVGDPDRTTCVGSVTHTVAGSMVGQPDVLYPNDQLLTDQLARVTKNQTFMNAREAVEALVGNAATANMFVVGAAIQLGVLPIRPDRVEEALTLNGVAVEANIAALRWGRAWLDDPGEVNAAINRISQRHNPARSQVVVPDLDRTTQGLVDRFEAGDLRELLQLLAADLIGYQDADLARQFLSFVEIVRDTEDRVGVDGRRLSTAVARGYHHLLAYKDEYEVARLLLGPEGDAEAAAVGGPQASVDWVLHPPMLRAIGMDTKMRIPRAAGRPLMRALARGKRFRGTRLDPFGRAEIRRDEQALPSEYRTAMEALLADLDADNYDHAVRVAALAMDVRGYESRKETSIAAFRDQLGQA